ncbi:UPF0389 protein CG9231-like isoform X2 [Branchiostoma floridae x Branchiostoma belcheri]
MSMLAARLPTGASLRALGCLARPTHPPAARPTHPPAAACQGVRTYSEGEKNPANIAGYHPGKVDKFALRATRKVKKGEEYPQEVSYDTMTAARDKLRVMVVTGIVVVAGLGAVWFIKKGKAERDHGDTLSKRNLARKEQWDAEKKAAETEAAAK